MIPKRTLAIIGMGEVGRCLSAAVADVGIWTPELCDPMPGGEALQIASCLDRPIRPDIGPWLSACDLVISAVTGSVSHAVVVSAAPWLRPGLCFVDLSTARPESLTRSAALCEERGTVFVDGAIMGAIALTGIRTPILLAGPAADAAARLLKQLGLRCSILPSSVPGDASSLKLIRSLFTKGLEALAVEALLVADRRGLRERLLEQLSVIDETPFADYLSVLVTSHVVHARRRLAEVEAVRDELRRDGFDLASVDATIGRFRATVLQLDTGELPPTAGSDVGETLAWLSARPAEANAGYSNDSEGEQHAAKQ